MNKNKQPKALSYELRPSMSRVAQWQQLVHSSPLDLRSGKVLANMLYDLTSFSAHGTPDDATGEISNTKQMVGITPSWKPSRESGCFYITICPLCVCHQPRDFLRRAQSHLCLTFFTGPRRVGRTFQEYYAQLVRALIFVRSLVVLSFWNWTVGVGTGSPGFTDTLSRKKCEKYGFSL